MPRYSVTIVASAAVSLAETSSTTATFSARGFSVVMYTSSRFYSWCSHCSEHREERGMVPDFRRVHLGWRDSSHSSTRYFLGTNQRSSASDLCGLGKTIGRLAQMLWTMVGMTDLGAQAGRVDLDAWTHGRRDRDLLQVATLGGRRLGSLQLVEHCPEVALQCVGLEAGFADGDVHVAVAVGSVLDLATFELSNRPADILSDRARLGVRHQPARPEHTTQAADERHHVRRGDGQVEIHVALLDCFGQIVGTDDVGSGVTGLLRSLAGCEHGDADVLTGSFRQRNSATDHLIGLARVYAQPDGDIDTLVERRLRHRLGQRHCLGRCEQLVPVEGLDRICELLS